MYGAGCGPCSSSCGAEFRNRQHAIRRTAPLFPGDTYGQAGQCGCGGSTCGSHGSCDGGSLTCPSGCGCQSFCDTNSNWMSTPVPLPSEVSPSCGCGAETTLQYDAPQSEAPSPASPQTSVPSTPIEHKVPSNSASTCDSNANDKAVEAGEVPVPPSDDPVPMPAESRVFEPDPPLPLNVAPDADGVPAASTPVDPISWKIPVL